MIDAPEVAIPRALDFVASFGLPGGAEREAIVPPVDWDAFLDELERERLTGLAEASAQSGELPLDDRRYEQLLDRHRGVMLWALRLERTLLDLADRFDEEGIETIVLKGPALSHSIYPDPSWRPFGDIDLLVQTGDWRRATGLLARLGVERRLPEPRAGFDERFGKGAVHLTATGIELDMHRSLALGPFGLWIEPDRLFDHSSGFVLGGRELRRLDDTALMAHACIHAALGFRTPIPMTVRDVAQVGLAGRIDWGLLREWAERWRLAPVIQHALNLASERFGSRWPSGAAAVLELAPGRRERIALDAYVTDRRSRGGTSLATIRAITGVRAKAAYLRALVLPDAEFLSARTNGSFRRRWTVPLRWIGSTTRSTRSAE